MSTSTHDGGVRSLTLAPRPTFAADATPLFSVDHRLVESEPPSLQNVLGAAALLWCTHAAWPTVRAIAACAGVAASSVLSPFGTSEKVRQALLTAERAALAELVDAHHGDLEAAVEARVDQLCAFDPRLSRLPLVAALAVGVNDAGELAVLASGVRPALAA